MVRSLILLLIITTTTVLMVSGAPAAPFEEPMPSTQQPNWKICELKYLKEECQALKIVAPNSMIPDITCLSSTNVAQLAGKGTEGMSSSLDPLALGPVCPPKTSSGTGEQQQRGSTPPTAQEGPIGPDGPRTGPKGSVW